MGIGKSVKDKCINLFMKSVAVDTAVWERQGCSRRGWFLSFLTQRSSVLANPRSMYLQRRNPSADGAMSFNFLKSSLAEKFFMSNRNPSCWWAFSFILSSVKVENRWNTIPKSLSSLLVYQPSSFPHPRTSWCNSSASDSRVPILSILAIGLLSVLRL